MVATSSVVHEIDIDIRSYGRPHLAVWARCNLISFRPSRPINPIDIFSSTLRLTSNGNISSGGENVNATFT